MGGAGIGEEGCAWRALTSPAGPESKLAILWVLLGVSRAYAPSLHLRAPGQSFLLGIAGSPLRLWLCVLRPVILLGGLVKDPRSRPPTYTRLPHIHLQVSPQRRCRAWGWACVSQRFT